MTSMMAKNLPSHSQFLQSLGGALAVAKLVKERMNLRRSPQLFTNSKRVSSGIPWKYRHVLAAVAKDRGLPIPVNFLGDDVQ